MDRISVYFFLCHLNLRPKYLNILLDFFFLIFNRTVLFALCLLTIEKNLEISLNALIKFSGCTVEVDFFIWRPEGIQVAECPFPVLIPCSLLWVCIGVVITGLNKLQAAVSRSRAHCSELVQTHAQEESLWVDRLEPWRVTGCRPLGRKAQSMAPEPEPLAPAQGLSAQHR